MEAITQHLITENRKDETYRIFGALSTGLRKEDKPVGDFDEFIAVIARGSDSEIVTRDHHFEGIPG